MSDIQDEGSEDFKPSGITKRIRRMLGQLEEQISTSSEERQKIREYNLEQLKYLFGFTIIAVTTAFAVWYVWFTGSPHCITMTNALPVCK